MKKKLKLLILITLLFSNFSHLMVASAGSRVSDDVIFGTLLNASQGGTARGPNLNTERLGSHALGGQRKSGSRFPTIKRGGDTTAFNPSQVDINILYDDYNRFVSDNDFAKNVHIVPINKVFSRSVRDTQDIFMTHGMGFAEPSYPIVGMPVNGIFDRNNKNIDWISIPSGYTNGYVYIESTSFKSSLYRGVTQYSNGRSDFGVKDGKIYDTRDFKTLKRVSLPKTKVAHAFTIDQGYGDEIDGYWDVKQVIFSNFSDFNLDDIDIIHNGSNKPTREQFITNYENTFNVKYDNSTKQLKENNKYLTYNNKDFSDKSVTINNTYITKNKDFIEPDKDADIGTQLNYTSLLTRIINSIKAIPEQIKEVLISLTPDKEEIPDEKPDEIPDEIPDEKPDKEDSEEVIPLLERLITAVKAIPEQIADAMKPLIPDVVSEAGSNIWDFLGDIVRALADITTSITNAIAGLADTLITSILDSLEFIIEKIISLVIPSSEKMAEHEAKLNNIQSDLSLKFKFLTEPIEDLKGVFSSPKSLHDVNFKIMGETVYIMPEMFRSNVAYLRSILTGVVVVFTMLNIYKRFSSDEVIT